MKKWTLGQVGKTNPIQTQYKANSNPIQSQFKANSNPNKPNFRGKKMLLFQLFAVGYLRKKLYSVTLLTGNIRLISRLMAEEQQK